MSTQLILYPQNYNGYAFNSQVLLNEYAANITFTQAAINTFGVSSGGLTWGISALGSYPAQVGNWRLIYSEATNATWSATTIPTISASSQTLTLYSSAGTGSSGSIAGAYQKLNGLTIGAQYRLTIEHSSLPSGSNFEIGLQGGGWFIFDGLVIGTVGNSPTVISNSGNTSTTFDFTAQQVDPILSVAYNNNTNQTITISKISVTEDPATAPLLPFDLSDGQVICDLYEEQDIPLTLSVDNFKNVAEKTQSYSKDFDLPATKRNNKIFTHIFDIQKTIENVYDFNPYLRTKAVLKQNGLLIFEGTMRLIQIKDDEGEISYNVNLFSETTALKETLEGRTIAHLNLDELNHEYNYTNITNSWEGMLTLTNNLASDSFALVSGLAANQTNVLKYPFCDWTGMVDCTDVAPEISRLEDAFRPWISVKYLLDNIARDAGYTFTSEFFDSTRFSKLYMDFNWGNTGGATDFTHTGSAYYHEDHGDHYAGTSFSKWNWAHDGSPDDFDADTGWSLPLDKFVCQQTNTYYKLFCRCWMVNSSGSTAKVNLRWVRKNVSGVFGAVNSFDYFNELYNESLGSGQVYEYANQLANSGSGIPLGVSGSGSDEIYIEWSSDTASAIKQYNLGNSFFDSVLWGRVYNNAEIFSSTLFNTERGKIKQWEFVKGIMTMFNLITMPDPTNPNNIIFEPYADMFVSDTSGSTLKDRSIQHDWTNKIDVSKIQFKPMDLKRLVVFKYSFDEEDYALNKYKVAAQGFEYGSKEINGSTAIVGSNQITNLSGIETIEAKPFSATIIKPLQDNFSNFVIPVIYGSEDNLSFESISNKPRILFNNGKVTQDYVVPGQNGVAGGTKSEYLQFSHFDEILADSDSEDFNFGECSLFPNVADPLSQPVDNLYNVYHAPYYDELYNVNTRTMSAQVYLTASDINTFDFRDKVMIKNKVYRVNKIDYKPNALSNVEFILLP